jgi:two-component system, cell cycle sensor histidine kinase and response regulator CckA
MLLMTYEKSKRTVPGLHTVADTTRRGFPAWAADTLHRWLLVPCLLVLLLCLGSSTSGAAGQKNILLLNSYHQGFAWTDDITRGVVTALQPVNDTTRLYIEYMNTKWVDDAGYFHELRNLLHTKYKRTPFSLIVSSDTDAFLFLKKHRDKLFGRVPVVFCGVNRLSPADLRGADLFTGVGESPPLRETLDLALRLHPATKQFFIINDQGISGRAVRDELERLRQFYQGRVSFMFQDSRTLERIVNDVAALPPDSLIFYSFFYGDPAAQFHENRESIAAIARQARVPLYSAWDFNLGRGIVGGKLISGYDQGLLAGQMALRIFQGVPVDHVLPVYGSPARFQFDYRQLQRFAIDRRLLPAGSTIINAPEPFHRISRGFARMIVVGGALMLLCLLALLFAIGQRRKAERLLRRAHDELDCKVRERTRELSVTNDALAAVNEELHKTQSILQKIIRSSPDDLFVIDRQLQIIQSNWVGDSQFPTPEERHRALCCTDAVDQDSARPCGACRPCTTKKVFETGKPVFAERFTSRFGYLVIRAIPIFDEHGSVTLVAEHVTDVNERKRMAQEVMNAQKLESLGVLAGGIAHNFNNILTGIVGNISLARLCLEDNAKAEAWLATAELGCDRAASLTRELITFSRGGSPVRSPVSLGHVLAEAVGSVSSGSGVTYASTLPDGLWQVDVDAGQIAQVFRNILTNAEQAMVNGGRVFIQAENVVVTGADSLPLEDGRYVLVSVRDQGGGIPEENLPRIFDPYFTTRDDGTGLGLAAAYSIIKNHQGYLAVESTAGIGTVVSLYLPVAADNQLPHDLLS